LPLDVGCFVEKRCARWFAMNMKEHILKALEEQMIRWEELLAMLSYEAIIAPRFDLDWSIQDVVCHLWAWQQITVARAEAALLGREPALPGWIAEAPGGWEENVDRTNAWIYQAHHALPWSEVVRKWRDGFRRLLEAGQSVPEMHLLYGSTYPWLRGHSLAAILIASYAHHQEHLEKLVSALQQLGTG
jgi:hypothetical protein